MATEAARKGHLRVAGTNRSVANAGLVRYLKRAGADVKARHSSESASPWVTSTQDVWLESQLDDDWMVAYRFSNQGGAPVIGEVRFFPVERDFPKRPVGGWSAEWLGVRAKVPQGGIRARMLRVQVGTSLNEFYEDADRISKRRDIPADVRRAFGLAGDVESFIDRRVRVTSSRDETHLALVALEYERSGRTPVKKMAARRGVKPAQVTAEVYQARQHGILTRHGQGKGGGTLTEKGRKLIDALKRRRARRKRRPASAKN